MAIPAYVTYYLDDEPLNVNSFQNEKSGSSLMIAFKHAVLFNGYELYTMNPLREHQPFIFTKIVDKSSVVLYEYMTNGRSIDTIIVDWYQYNPKTQKDEVYFQHTLEKAKIVSIKHSMPNVKDVQYATNVHAEEIALRYDSIKWFCPEGYIESSDVWAYSLALRGLKKKKWKEKAQEAETVSDDFADWFAEQNKPKAKKIFKVHIVDPEDVGFAKVKIKLRTGDEYFTDSNGDVTIEKDATAPDTIEIVEICLAESKQSQSPSGTSAPSQPTGGQVPDTPITPVVPPPVNSKSVCLTLIDSNGNKLKGVVVTIDTGETFESDENGIVNVQNYAGASETFTIISMKFAA